jgi:hypothetical protein
MTEQPTCPICSTKFETWGSVKGHITRSQGEHEGLSGPEVVEEMQTESGDKPETSDGNGSNPTMETPSPADGSNGTEELPCGHESFDPDNAPKPPFHAYCDTCGEAWVVEEL